MHIDYNLHVGDFDNNGYSDIFVDRLTAGQVDGSLQDTILYRQSNGTFNSYVPSTSEAATARSYPIGSSLEPCLGDINYDGHADLIIENIGQQVGSNIDDVVVFASGEQYTALPANARSIDQGVLRFINDQKKFAINPAYFVQNTNVSVRPKFGLTIDCIYDTGLSLPFNCTISGAVTGYETNIGIGYNPSSPGFGNKLLSIANNLNTTGDSDWWILSQKFNAIYGVHAFGFAADGSRTETDYRNSGLSKDNAGEFGAIFPWLIRQIWGRINRDPASVPEAQWLPHVYGHTQNICNSNDPFWNGHCTVGNVLCWAKRIPAPRSDPNGSDTSVVQDGEEIVLAGNNHIVVYHQGSTILNETVDPHMYHDIHATPGCGDMDPIPNRCAIVARTIKTGSTSGDIDIETVGTGYNESAELVLENEVIGNLLFRFINSETSRAIKKYGDCASWDGVPTF